MSKFVAPLLNISAEGELQREIKDVIDELDIMLYLQNQQLNVMETFKKEVELLSSDSDRGKLRSQPASPGISPTSPTSTYGSNALRKGQGNHDWFAKKSQELLNEAKDRIERLKGLRQSAESVSASVSFPSYKVPTDNCPSMHSKEFEDIADFPCTCSVGESARSKAATSLCRSGLAVRATS